LHSKIAIFHFAFETPKNNPFQVLRRCLVEKSHRLHQAHAFEAFEIVATGQNTGAPEFQEIRAILGQIAEIVRRETKVEFGLFVQISLAIRVQFEHDLYFMNLNRNQ